MTDYQKRRSQCEYYKIVEHLVSLLANTTDVDSIIDVGCGETDNILYWSISDKSVFDYWTTPNFPGVKCLHGNLENYEFGGNQWDIVVCMQTLEHIRLVDKAIHQLFSISKRYVIISLPYKWPNGKELDHIHDPIDDAKLKLWFEPFVSAWNVNEIRYCDSNTRVILLFEKRS